MCNCNDNINSVTVYSGPPGPTGPTGPAGQDSVLIGTSTTNLTPLIGTISLVTQSGISWIAGQRLRITDGAPTTPRVMEGVVVSYTATSLTLNVDYISGPLTLWNSWFIAPCGEIGATGATGATGPTGYASYGKVIAATSIGGISYSITISTTSPSADNSWMIPNAIIYIKGAGYYQIVSLISTNGAVINDLLYPSNNTAFLLTASTGSPLVVTPSGIRGEIGAAGTNGTSGINGENAFTTLTSSVPTGISQYTITVNSTAWMIGESAIGANDGQAIFISGCGYFQVVTVIGSSQAVILDLGYAGNNPANLTSGILNVSPAAIIGGQNSVAYTPTFNNTSNDMVFSSLPATGYHITYGNLVHVEISISLASCTSFGTTSRQLQVTLPHNPARKNYNLVGQLSHPGTGVSYAITGYVTAGSNLMTLYYHTTSAGNVVSSQLTGAAPVTLAVADTMIISFDYEKA